MKQNPSKYPDSFVATHTPTGDKYYFKYNSSSGNFQVTEPEYGYVHEYAASILDVSGWDEYKFSFDEHENEMNLPDKFEFTTDIGATYTATKEYPDGYRVSSNLHSGTAYWEASLIRKSIKDGFWEMVGAGPQPNGVGANGTPIYFDKTMLQMFDRIVTDGYSTYIVTSLGDEPIAHSAHGGYLFFHDKNNPSAHEFNAAEVYSKPIDTCQRICHDFYGDLRWKRQEFPAPETAKEKAIRELKETISKASEQIAQFEKEV